MPGRTGRRSGGGAGEADVVAADAWVYVLRCRDGSLYTGWSVDVERRAGRTPVRYCESLHAQPPSGEARRVVADAGPPSRDAGGGAHQGTSARGQAQVGRLSPIANDASRVTITSVEPRLAILSLDFGSCPRSECERPNHLTRSVRVVTFVRPRVTTLTATTCDAAASSTGLIAPMSTRPRRGIRTTGRRPLC